MVKSKQCGEAEILWRKLLDHRRKTLGLKAQATFGAMNSIALCCGKQGRLQEEEQLFVYLLELCELLEDCAPVNIWREKLEYCTKETQDSEVKLWIDQACELLDIKRYEEAELLCQKVVDRRMELFGPKHRRTLQAKFLLAIIYRNQGQYQESERLLSLAIRTLKIGVKSLFTAGKIYKNQVK